MNDELGKVQHEPKYPSDNHFPDFHHDHLKELDRRIKVMDKDVMRLEQCIAKQRAVNEALIFCIDAFVDGHDELVLALREALK